MWPAIGLASSYGRERPQSTPAKDRRAMSGSPSSPGDLTAGPQAASI